MLHRVRPVGDDEHSITALLARAGMDDRELVRIGAAQAYERMRASEPDLTIEVFYALEVAARMAAPIATVRGAS